VKDLVVRERAVTLEILLHLTEVERRRLHVELGYASMFDYCTRHLRYSSSAASRRIQAARCIRDYPEVYAMLEKNEVNLVTISLVASILNETTAKDLLGKIRGKSQREVEAIACAYRPPIALRDRARPVWVAATEPVATQPVKIGQEGPITPTGGSEISPRLTTGDKPAGGSAATTAASSAGGQTQAPPTTQAQLQVRCQANDNSGPAPLVQKRFIQFLASERFMKKLEKAKALLSNKTTGPSYEFVLEAALDEFLRDHDPEERKKRRDERDKKREERKPATGARNESGAGATRKNVGSRVEGGNDSAGSGQADDPLFRRRIGDLPASRVPANDEGASRRIPAATRDAVFARDKGRCTYVGSNGERCAATHHLQIDHVIPYARGGANAPGNLRLLCERHNKKEAERVLGTDAMRGFRARE
jgi:hypothetical protein